MFNFSARKFASVICVLSFLAVPVAFAKPHDQAKHHYGHHYKHHHHKHKHPKPINIKPIIVKPRPGMVVKPHRPIVVKPHKPKHRRYHRHDLPRRAAFAVIAGVSYAIIDNMYYQKYGKEYIYDPRPPIGR